MKVLGPVPSTGPRHCLNTELSSLEGFTLVELPHVPFNQEPPVSPGHLHRQTALLFSGPIWLPMVLTVPCFPGTCQLPRTHTGAPSLWDVQRSRHQAICQPKYLSCSSVGANPAAGRQVGKCPCGQWVLRAGPDVEDNPT